MKHTTVIDTVGIQINCYTHSRQVEVVKELIDFIDDIESLHVNYKDYRVGITTITTRVYFIHYKRSTVATISTSTYVSMSRKAMYPTVYCIKVKFAGLRSYHAPYDKASKEFLYEMCSYLNRWKIEFKLTELDIAIDTECHFNNILAICTKKAPRIKYHSLIDKQAYVKTFYIEKLAKDKFKKATRRAYVYDKSEKEKLSSQITRFELKLQRIFFNRHGASVKAIEKSLANYCVMYFKDINKKQAMIEADYSYTGLPKDKIRKLGMAQYRLKPDIEVIEEFLKEMHIPLHPPLKRV